jgi:MFS family permease
MTATVAAPVSPWAAGYARTTVGVFSLSFLFAFEALAVAAVMPQVANELDGLRWYPVTFAAALAASVVALVVAGPSVDRRGPRSAVMVGLLVFCAGVVVAGAAPTMPVFLVGRLVHGFGGGVLGVALYVVVAQAYPEQLRARVFAVLTAGWVLPALVGPAIATTVANAFGWRWVFLGVPVAAIGSWLLVRGAPSRPGDGGPGRIRLGTASVAAAGVLAVSVGGQRPAAWPALVGAGLVAVVFAGRRLLPPGALRGRHGLPSVVGTRAGVGTAFAAAEVYLPLLLTLDRGLTLAAAGWVLTAGALTWCLGAFLAARLPWLSDPRLRVRLGVWLVALGIGGFAAVAVPGLPLLVPVLCWGLAGLGIGMAFSTLSVLALAYAPDGEQGRTSSALQLTDYLVQSCALAIGSVVFAGFAGRDPVAGATLLVIAAALVGLLAVVPASRLRPEQAVSRTDGREARG